MLRERELVLRERELAPPDLDAVERAPVDLRVPVDLRPVDERLAPEVDDFALAPRFAVDALVVERLAVERFAVDLRAELLRDEDAELAPPLELSAAVHFPDMTRCAASATASAMIEPSFVALATTLLAACEAVSAASSPASRIFFRAAGLALIAAAAAARPAASISLLIAALASLSTVSPAVERDDDELERDPEELDREELLRADLAIAYLPPSEERHLNAVPVP